MTVGQSGTGRRTNAIINLARVKRLPAKTTQGLVAGHQYQTTNQVFEVLRIFFRVIRELHHRAIMQDCSEKCQTKHVSSMMILESLLTEVVALFPTLHSFPDTFCQSSKPT